MQMRNVRLGAPGAKLLTQAVRDHANSLVARNRVADFHLDVGKELVFRGPTVAMVYLHMAKGFCNHCSGCCGRHPKGRGVLPNPHIVVWRKVDGTPNAEMVRA